MIFIEKVDWWLPGAGVGGGNGEFNGDRVLVLQDKNSEIRFTTI